MMQVVMSMAGAVLARLAVALVEGWGRHVEWHRSTWGTLRARVPRLPRRRKAGQGQGRSVDERFTDVADTVSSGTGNWRTSAIAFAVFLVWLFILGPLMHFSDSWQLWANTPTTWIELWLGFLACASANRVQRVLFAVLDRIANMVQGTAAQGERLEALEAKLDQHVSTQGAMLAHVHAWVQAQQQAAEGEASNV